MQKSNTAPFNELAVIENLKQMLKKVVAIRDAHGLAKVPTITYEMREAGEDMLYFQKLTWNDKEKVLTVKPVVKQKDYKTFFEMPMEGSKGGLCKYNIWLTETEVKFYMKSRVEDKIVKTHIPLDEVVTAALSQEKADNLVTSLHDTDYVLRNIITGELVRFKLSGKVILYSDRIDAQEDAELMGTAFNSYEAVSCSSLDPVEVRNILLELNEGVDVCA